MTNRATFSHWLAQHPWDEALEKVYASDNEKTVLQILQRGYAKDLQDFAALVSPAAEPYLPQLAHLSQQATQKRFGKTVQMYIPMYLSNECQNICTYCGFSFTNKVPRKTLTPDEILGEVAVIKQLGFDHILLVAGEAHRTVGADYLAKAIRLIKPHFSNITIEVQPLETDEYKLIKEAGGYGVLVYQETYNRESYAAYHTKGRKSNFEYRLATPERAGQAGVHKIGLGALLGLSDWRADSWFCAAHLLFLKKRFWQTRFSISFPRLRPAEGYTPESIMTDRQLLQLIAAWRLLDGDVELSISTREHAQFRDHIFKYGITSMSAGSKTDPGGYTNHHALEQFEIDDHRPASEVAAHIRSEGYVPVWKDWEKNVL